MYLSARTNTRGDSCVKGAPQDEYFHWSSRENVLCIYVEYCVTSRAGKCLETCNTDKPRFDDFAARVARALRVRAAGFTGSISSLLSQRNSPRDTAIEIFQRKKLHRRSYLLVEQHKLSSRST